MGSIGSMPSFTCHRKLSTINEVSHSDTMSELVTLQYLVDPFREVKYTPYSLPSLPSVNTPAYCRVNILFCIREYLPIIFRVLFRGVVNG